MLKCVLTKLSTFIVSSRLITHFYKIPVRLLFLFTLWRFEIFMGDIYGFQENISTSIIPIVEVLEFRKIKIEIFTSMVIWGGAKFCVHFT